MKIPAILLERTLSSKKWRRMQVFLLLKRQAKGGSIVITNDILCILASKAECSCRTIQRSVSELYADRWIYRTRTGLTILNGWQRIRREIEGVAQKSSIHTIPEGGRFSISWLRGLCFASGIHMLEKRKSVSGVRSGLSITARPLQRPHRKLNFNTHSNTGLSTIYGIGKNLIRKGKKAAAKAGLIKVLDNFHQVQCSAKSLVALKTYLLKSDQGGPLMIHKDGTACYRLPDLFASLM